MQFLEFLLVFEVLRAEVLGEVGLAHVGDRLVQGQPVQLLDQFPDVVAVEVGRPVYALLDFDDQGEVVLLALGHVAD